MKAQLQINWTKREWGTYCYFVREYPMRTTIRPVFAWYDFWVGLFVDRQKQRVYFFPVPMFGLVIEWEQLS